jgi:ppGpp synthetase/RelA/SpoT-type nucleotidyltranferase
METLLTSASFLFFLGSLFLLMCVYGLRQLYRCNMRQYEQKLNSTYIAHFEERATVARSLHANVSRMVHLSKSAVDQARESSSDVAGVKIVLKQVSEWLQNATQESNQALKSFENAVPPKAR